MIPSKRVDVPPHKWSDIALRFIFNPMSFGAQRLTAALVGRSPAKGYRLQTVRPYRLTSPQWEGTLNLPASAPPLSMIGERL
jgi:hypothetical protein